jgi:hypothetical protein
LAKLGAYEKKLPKYVDFEEPQLSYNGCSWRKAVVHCKQRRSSHP